jgi:ABC-type amino acid transport substrate-binding protein
MDTMRYRLNLRTMARAGLAACLVLAAVAAPLSSGHAQGTLDRILRDKKVRIGWSAYEPLEWRDPKTQELSGYMVEAIRAIFAEVNVQPEFVEVNYATLVASIQSGDIDMSIVDSFITVKRAAAVAYTQPIGFNGSMFLVRADETRFKTLEDLNKPSVKIASLLGGSGQDFIRRFLPNATPIAVNTGNKAAPFLEVAAGRADAGLNDAWTAKHYMEAQPGLKALFDKPVGVRPTAWIVNKGNTDLLNFINSSLNVILLDGEFQAMAAKYPAIGEFTMQRNLIPFP